MISFANLIHGLVFLLASLPFLISHHARPIPTFYPELLAFVLGLGLIGAIAWRHGLSFGAVILAPLVWLLIIACQFAFASAPTLQDALGFALFVTWGMLLAAALRRFIAIGNAPGLDNALAFGLLTGAILNAIVAILQVSVYELPGVFYAYDGSISGNISQRNLLASYMTLGVISAIHLHASKRLPGVWLYPALLLLGFALSISTARSILVYMFWIAGSVLVMRRFAGDTQRNIGVLCFVLSLLFWQLLHSWVITILPGLADLSLAERFRTQGIFDGVRQSLLAVAWQMFSEHPLLGAGLGSFDQWVFWKAQPNAGGGPAYLSNSEHAHNIIAQLIGELGILALLPLLVMLAALLRNSATPSPFGWWRWVAAGVLILHSLLEYPLWYLHFLGLIAFLLAASGPAQRWTFGRSRTLQLVTATGIGLALIAGLALLVDYWRLENYPVKRLPPAQLVGAFNEISANLLLGQHARSFLAANISPLPVRIPEKLALCQRSIGEYADEAVIRACLPIYDLAGRREEAQKLRERLSLNVSRMPVRR